MLIGDGKTPRPQITQINLISPLLSTSFSIKPTFVPFCSKRQHLFTSTFHYHLFLLPSIWEERTGEAEWPNGGREERWKGEVRAWRMNKLYSCLSPIEKEALWPRQQSYEGFFKTTYFWKYKAYKWVSLYIHLFPCAWVLMCRKCGSGSFQNRKLGRAGILWKSVCDVLGCHHTSSTKIIFLCLEDVDCYTHTLI